MFNTRYWLPSQSIYNIRINLFKILLFIISLAEI